MSMQSIQGFLVHDQLVSSSPGVISQFGQLSAVSNTFSLTKSFAYNDSVAPDVQFVGFFSQNNLGNDVSIPTYVANHLLAVAQFIYARCGLVTVGGTYPTPSITADPASLISDLVTAFNVGTVTISSVSIDSLIISTANSAARLPGSVSWSFVDTSQGSQVNNIQVWFNDLAFQTEYLNTTIIVLPPLSPVSLFDDTVANVATRLAAVTPNQIVNALQAAIGNNPPTVQVSQAVQWQEPPTYDSGNSGPNLMVYWNVVIYGPAGNNPQSINAAIQNYLEAQPPLTGTDTWQEIFPSVFQTSEYFIIPLWDSVIYPQPPILYSPMVSAYKLMATAVANLPLTMQTSYLQQYLRASTSIFQELFFLAIGAPTNTNNDFDLKIKYPDYMNIALNTQDANRMGQATIGFVAFLTTLLQGASTLTVITPQSQIAVGYSKAEINGKLFLTGNYLGTQYYALAKASYTPVA